MTQEDLERMLEYTLIKKDTSNNSNKTEGINLENRTVAMEAQNKSLRGVIKAIQKENYNRHLDIKLKMQQIETLKRKLDTEKKKIEEAYRELDKIDDWLEPNQFLYLDNAKRILRDLLKNKK